MAEALGSVLASCHIGGAAPDAAIDRSFIAAGLAARTLEEFLSHRQARTPSPAATDGDGDSDGDGDGDEGAARAAAERSGRGRGAGLPERGAEWRAVRGCCAAVRVLSGAGRWERRGDRAICAEHGAARAAGLEQRDERQRRRHPPGTEPCACGPAALSLAAAAGATHRGGQQVGTGRRPGGGPRGGTGRIITWHVANNKWHMAHNVAHHNTAHHNMAHKVAHHNMAHHNTAHHKEARGTGHRVRGTWDMACDTAWHVAHRTRHVVAHSK